MVLEAIEAVVQVAASAVLEAGSEVASEEAVSQAVGNSYKTQQVTSGFKSYQSSGCRDLSVTNLVRRASSQVCSFISNSLLETFAFTRAISEPL